MGRYNKYRTKLCTHTHTSWWLVLGWVTTKEYHPCIRFRNDKLHVNIKFHLHFTFATPITTWMMRFTHNPLSLQVTVTLLTCSSLFRLLMYCSASGKVIIVLTIDNVHCDDLLLSRSTVELNGILRRSYSRIADQCHSLISIGLRHWTLRLKQWWVMGRGRTGRGTGWVTTRDVHFMYASWCRTCEALKGIGQQTKFMFITWQALEKYFVCFNESAFLNWQKYFHTKSSQAHKRCCTQYSMLVFSQWTVFTTILFTLTWKNYFSS